MTTFDAFPSMSALYPDPLWVQAVDHIAREIAEGRLPPGSRLPPERELCADLNISRVTLRKALQKLVEDGVLRSSHGRGWFVAAGPQKDWPNSLESFTETAERMGLEASSRILRAEVAPATIDEAEELAIAPGTALFHLERVRMLSSAPIAIDDSRVPASMIPDASSIDFTRASLYEQLAGAGLDLARAESTIEARPADPYLALHLGIEPGSPILAMRQVVADAGDRPIFSSLIRYAGDRYRLRTSFSRTHPHSGITA
ncbi:GntR family transcriptional regulator [Naasia lichenicola]|uniref:GntR family transcriptional regulator n=1 Tax=Naasia lichenicola TaxID=2565933 RepID=A0A4S4FIC3_9MICO|nr:GntR family transcriptional regulator [Naasia lichenicola]THG29604.1 GntR family transcriptional regulator [Naasia lichenicola]